MIRCLYSLARSLASLDHWNARRLRTPSSSPIPLTFAGQLWSSIYGQLLAKSFCAFEKASSLQTEGHAKLPRNLHVGDGGKTRSMSVKRIAYTRFRSLFEIFFSCRKSCRTAPGARERRLLKGLEDESHRGISQKNSISRTTEGLTTGLFHERRPESIWGQISAPSLETSRHSSTCAL